MNNDKEEVLEVEVKAPKNVRGALGPICNYCGGYGFTLAFGQTGNSKGCTHCDQTGVEPMSNIDIQRQIIKLNEQLLELKEIILKFGNDKIEETN
jgi:hypothetical protein